MDYSRYWLYQPAFRGYNSTADRRKALSLRKFEGTISRRTGARHCPYGNRYLRIALLKAGWYYRAARVQVLQTFLRQRARIYWVQPMFMALEEQARKNIRTEISTLQESAKLTKFDIERYTIKEGELSRFVVFS